MTDSGCYRNDVLIDDYKSKNLSLFQFAKLLLDFLGLAFDF